LSHQVTSPRLAQTIAGIRFDNPLGLAAGFDKNGVALGMLGSLGFGHIEIGSISAHSSQGNPRPRLFRVAQDEGIVVHYGVPNEGAPAVAARLEGHRPPVPLGISLVKTNDAQRPATDDEVLWDYLESFKRLERYASFIDLNLSCPNSANDRNYFDEIGKIDALLKRFASERPRVPVFLKLKPTLDAGWLRELVHTTDAYPFVAGFGVNLPAGKPPNLKVSIPRTALEKLPGAIAGRPVEGFINEHLRLLYGVLRPKSRYRLMAAGGVFSAEEAYRKVRLGASLVQIYTALVYRGPSVVREILDGLSRLLERDHFNTISEAIGIDSRSG
jgi:dihydroorotate dehydrogenase (fumarate)/dihydroorotate dehydrogenase